MMMQYANVVNPGQAGTVQPPQLPVGMPSTRRWPTQGIDTPYREGAGWGSEDQLRASTTSSSPVRYPPPSSSPSSLYSYDPEEPESDIGPSDGRGSRGRVRGTINSSPIKPSASSIPRLPSALVSRPSSLSRSRHDSRSGSRVKKRVSFELESIEQVIQISSEEEQDEEEHYVDEHDEQGFRHLRYHDAHDERRVRAGTPGPADRPTTRQSSRTRIGTPAPRRAASPQEQRILRRASQRLR